MYRRWMPLIAVAALLAGGVLAAALSSPSLMRVPLPTERTGKPAGASHAPAAAARTRAPGGGGSGFHLPGWVNLVVAGLCLAFVAVVVGMLIWYVVRDRFRVRSAPLVTGPGPAKQPVATRTEDVVAALDAGLTGLSDQDADPRRAVIACWVRLEEAAAAAGTPRHPGDTPTDLVARLPVAHQVSRPVPDDFAPVYRHARYATHVVDERMRVAAIRSLGHLRAELTGRVGGGIATPRTSPPSTSCWPSTPTSRRTPPGRAGARRWPAGCSGRPYWRRAAPPRCISCCCRWASRSRTRCSSRV